MDIWIISDTHFNHDNIIKYCNRPMDFEGQILDNLKIIDSSNDILIHLGDICIGDDLTWHKILNNLWLGKKWLVRGNHDRKSFSWYMEQGWDCVVDKIELNIYGKHLWLSHKPIKDIPQDVLNIHGHHHNVPHHPEDWWVTDNHKLFCLEHHYKPIKLRDFVE